MPVLQAESDFVTKLELLIELLCQGLTSNDTPSAPKYIFCYFILTFTKSLLTPDHAFATSNDSWGRGTYFFRRLQINLQVRAIKCQYLRPQ